MLYRSYKDNFFYTTYKLVNKKPAAKFTKGTPCNGISAIYDYVQKRTIISTTILSCSEALASELLS